MRFRSRVCQAPESDEVIAARSQKRSVRADRYGVDFAISSRCEGNGPVLHHRTQRSVHLGKDLAFVALIEQVRLTRQQDRSVVLTLSTLEDRLACQRLCQ